MLGGQCVGLQLAFCQAGFTVKCQIPMAGDEASWELVPIQSTVELMSGKGSSQCKHFASNGNFCTAWGL